MDGYDRQEIINALTGLEFISRVNNGEKTVAGRIASQAYRICYKQLVAMDALLASCETLKEELRKLESSKKEVTDVAATLAPPPPMPNGVNNHIWNDHTEVMKRSEED